MIFNLTNPLIRVRYFNGNNMSYGPISKKSFLHMLNSPGFGFAHVDRVSLHITEEFVYIDHVCIDISKTDLPFIKREDDNDICVRGNLYEYLHPSVSAVGTRGNEQGEEK